MAEPSLTYQGPSDAVDHEVAILFFMVVEGFLIGREGRRLHKAGDRGESDGQVVKRLQPY